MRAISEIVVHCSATPAGRVLRAADIRRMHTDPNRPGGPFDDIGYHYVIGLDGQVEPGRPVERIGAHVKNHNRNSIGICLIGGVDAHGKAANTFTTQQFTALRGVLRGLRDKYPKARILGHRDFAGVKKDCPSFDVRSWLKEQNIEANP